MPSDPDAEAAVRLSFEGNGPILVETDGPTVISRDGRAEQVARVTIALCRCGQSGTKPSCDGTHRRAGFLAPPASLELRSGPGAED